MPKLILLFANLIVGIAFVHAFRALRFHSTPFHLSSMRAVTSENSYDLIQQKFKALVHESTQTDDQKRQQLHFIEEYGRSALEANLPVEEYQRIIGTFLKSVSEAVNNPYRFSSYHQAIRDPIDYYKWGNDFFRSLIIPQTSKLDGIENAHKIKELVDRGENVVIFSNHQTEADPQVISILLENNNLGDLAEKMIFIAGHKVTSDPVAIPFSMGRNLICIHSKKHIQNPPEEYARKQAQNKASVNELTNLFKAGGNVVWLAPSGGRDRPNENNKFTVADFDPKSVELFKLISLQIKQPMHFFPMAMFTNQLVPPPATVSSSVGEERSLSRGSVSVHFLDEEITSPKDRDLSSRVQKRVEDAYEVLYQWHSLNKA